jgi:hypothetical protein
MHAKTIFSSEIEILDISLKGARIQGRKSLKIGGNYQIKFRHEGEPLSFHCTVVWEKLTEAIKQTSGETVPVYIAGVEFTDVFSDKTLGLFKFVDKCLISYEQRIGGVRITIDRKERSQLDHEESYNVKKISLAGMLIETEEELQLEGRFPMKLFLPDASPPIEFQGRIASCIKTPHEKTKGVDIGIEFLDMAENDKSRLNNFIKSL